MFSTACVGAKLVSTYPPFGCSDVARLTLKRDASNEASRLFAAATLGPTVAVTVSAPSPGPGAKTTLVGGTPSTAASDAASAVDAAGDRAVALNTAADELLALVTLNTVVAVTPLNATFTGVLVALASAV